MKQRKKKEESYLLTFKVFFKGSIVKDWRSFKLQTWIMEIEWGPVIHTRIILRKL